jgi:oleate hydratase
VPVGAKNFAFIGQFCEIPDDVVFTVEYSVRSARIAVYALLDIKQEIPPVFKGQHDVGVLFNALKTMQN